MKAWNYFLAHGDKWFAAATTVLAALGAAGVISQPYLIAAGAALTFVHNTFLPEPKSTPPALPKQNVGVLKCLLFALVPGILLIAGCATMKNFFGSPTGQAVAVAAVDVAVATAEQKGVQPAVINSIAKKALAADQGTSASLAAISAVVNGELAKLHLPAGDMAAAQILEVAFNAALQAKIGNNPTLAQTQAAVAVLLQQVIVDTGG